MCSMQLWIYLMETTCSIANPGMNFVCKFFGNSQRSSATIGSPFFLRPPALQVHKEAPQRNMLSRFGISYSYEPGLLVGKLAPSAKLSDCSRKPGNMLVLREEIGNAHCSERNTYGYSSCMAPMPRLFLRHWRDWFSSWRQKALAVLEKTAGTKHYKVNLRAQSQHGTIVICAHQNSSLAPTSTRTGDLYMDMFEAVSSKHARASILRLPFHGSWWACAMVCAY